MNRLIENLPPEEYIIRVEPGSKEWHAIRATTVGSSEVAALFDASPYLTRFELYHRKLGTIADGIEDSERMFWGRMLEEKIAEGAAQKHSWELIRPRGYYMHPTIKGMGATPDMLAEAKDKPGLGILEVKNVDGLQFRREWLNDEPPLHYLLQLQDLLACTGLAWGAIVALIGGNDLKVFHYDRHAEAITRIQNAVVRFWQDVAAKQEPRAVAEDLEIMKKIFPASAALEVDLTTDNELPSLCADFLHANEERKALEKRENAAKAEILRKVGMATFVRCNGFNISRKEIVSNIAAKDAHTKTQVRLNVKEMTQ